MLLSCITHNKDEKNKHTPGSEEAQCQSSTTLFIECLSVKAFYINWILIAYKFPCTIWNYKK